MSIPALFANYQGVRWCTTQNKDKSAASTLFRKEKVNDNESRNRDGPTRCGKQWQKQQWRGNHPSSWYHERIKCAPQPRRSWRKRQSSRMRRLRRTLQPPILHTIHPKLQGRSCQFWRGIRDQRKTERSQGPVQEVEQESEVVQPMRIT